MKPESDHTHTSYHEDATIESLNAPEMYYCSWDVYYAVEMFTTKVKKVKVKTANGVNSDISKN